MKEKTLTGLKKDPLNLNKLLLVWIKSFFLGLFIKPKDFKLPKRIGEYRYVNDFEKIGTVHDFKLGIYKNSKGKRVMVKLWQRAYKDFAYYNLQNEITMYTIFSNVISRTGKKMPPRFRRVRIPELIAWSETNSSLYLVTSFAKGKIANELSDSAFKLKTYLLVTEYIRYLGEKMLDGEKSYCSKRGPSGYAFLYPLILAKALITHPRAGLQLVLGAPKFIRSLPYLFSSHRSVLTHRDLHFKNIIVDRANIILIDLQLCVFTELMHELVTTLRYRWMEDAFHNMLLSEIKKEFGKRRNFQILFSGLCIYSATHGLSGRNFPKRKIDYWIEFLKFGIRPNFKTITYK